MCRTRHMGLALIAIVLLSGCHSMQVSTPPRTALEQLLLSTASDRAVRDADLSWLNGKKVYIEEKYFESYDKGYAVGALRQRIAESGALLVNDANAKAGSASNAPPGVDYIIEIRSGALAMNSATTLIGLPSMAIPVPLSGSLQTPEIALYKSEKSDSYGKFALFAYKKDTGEYVQSSGRMDGTAKYHLYKLFGVSWKRTDIPEFKKHKKSEPSPEANNPK